MNIEHLTPANEIKGFSPEAGEVVSVVVSAFLPPMERIRNGNQIRPSDGTWGGKGLRLRIDTLQALGMTDSELREALTR